MAVTNTFLSQYLNSAEITKFSSFATPSPLGGKTLIVDYPIKEVDKFLALAGIRMNYMHYGGFTICVANEAGAIVAALIAAGYTPMEIIEMRSSGAFDPVQLIEGGQKLPSKLHVQKRGADHKGHRFRDRLNELLRAKIVGDPKSMVTFAELHNGGKRLPLYITVLDLTTAAIVPLSYETFPVMSVADAVLASCAVQPYIGQVTYKTAEKVEHKFVACSTKQSLPVQTAQQIFQARGVSGSFAASAEGYGFKGTENAAGSQHASGSDLYKVILSQRAAAVYPDAMRQRIYLF